MKPCFAKKKHAQLSVVYPPSYHRRKTSTKLSNVEHLKIQNEAAFVLRITFHLYTFFFLIDSNNFIM